VLAYNGGLFSVDRNVSPVGAELEKLRLSNRDFGHALSELLVEATEEGWGPVDFRSLSVREFGTIYEGLLENELAVAEEDLAVESRDKTQYYRPARPRDEVTVRRGQVYPRNTSGARKSTGSYFTKHFAVEHLLDNALEPALAEHLERLDGLSERAAAEAFFDFRVADIAMGSAHFLVTAVDRIEKAFSGYLANRPLPQVLRELERLRRSALEALGPLGETIEIEDTQLLRRQIARRCVYGVDLNPIAVQLARLSLWVHTFVPGLPLSFLDHNLVEGNSLVGMATVEEAVEWLKEVVNPLFAMTTEELVGPAREALGRLGQISDANAAEIAAARQAFREAQDAVAPARALFDVLAAARIDARVFAHVQQRASHWKDAPETVLRSEALKLAKEALNAIPPFHFPIAFPEVFLRKRPGFDAILGNPPWEKARVEEDHFWTRYSPGFVALSKTQQAQRKRQLLRERPELERVLAGEVTEADLLRRVLTAGAFPGMGTGDPDVYKAFCWRFWALARVDGGRTGVVLPRSVFAAKGSEPFRMALLTRSVVQDLTFLLNRAGWAFDDAEPRYTITLCGWCKRDPRPDACVPVRGPFSSLRHYQDGLRRPPAKLPVAGLTEWTDEAAVPLLPAPESADVFLRIRMAPRLDLNEAASWRAMPYRELDPTSDKRLMQFRDERPEGLWPVYKGESFDIWQPDTKRYYAWGDPEKVTKHLQKKRLRSARVARSPFREFRATWLRNAETLPCNRPRIAFRRVTNRTNQRTVIVGLAPPRVFIADPAPHLLWPRGDEKDEAYLLGILSSLPLDWYARRMVETHLDYHNFNPLPVPRPLRADPLWQRTVELAGRLACPDVRFRSWAKAVGVECGRLEEREKEDMIRELDGVVAHLYGLSEPQLQHIFETFHEGWDYQERWKATCQWYQEWRRRLSGRNSQTIAN
jgi:hypothetical protein